METNQFYHNQTSSCMTLDTNTMGITLESCDGAKLEQKWYIESLFQLEEI